MTEEEAGRDAPVIEPGSAPPPDEAAPADLPAGSADAPEEPTGSPPLPPKRKRGSKRRRSRPQPWIPPSVRRWLTDPARMVWILLAALTLAAALLRFWNLGSNPLWDDEANSSLAALHALHTGSPIEPNLPWTLRIQNIGPAYPEIESWSLALFGVNDAAARVPAAVLGTLMVPLAFLLGRRVQDTLTGLTYAAMVAFSTELISWSRQARFYILLDVLYLVIVLLALAWPRVSARMRPLLVVALVGAIAAAAMSSLANFLLAVPAFLAGGAAWWLAGHRAEVVRFLGLARAHREGGRWVPYRYRPWAVLGTVAVVVVVAAFPPVALLHLWAEVFEKFFHYPPRSFLWVPAYGSYLVTYYPTTLALALVGGALALLRFRPVLVGLGVFLVAGFIVVSGPQQVVVNPNQGGVVFERHFVPFLPVLVLFAALGLVWVLRMLYREARHLTARTPLPDAAKPILTVTAVVLVLTLPMLLFPATVMTYPNPTLTAYNSRVPWSEYSVDPAYPSALYNTVMPDYRTSSEYVLAHRTPGNVVVAIFPGPVTWYLGYVNYWVNPQAPVGDIWNHSGVNHFSYTGTLQLNTTGQFIWALEQSGGWFLEDVEAQGAPGRNTSLAIQYFTNFVPAGSTNSMNLYQWNGTGAASLLLTAESHRPDLMNSFGSNLSALIGWAAVTGVTRDTLRPILIYLEAWMLTQLPAPALPLATLLDVYNHRPDLEAAYPQVLNNQYAALVAWAVKVVKGQISDPAAAQLDPYATWYESYRGP